MLRRLYLGKLSEETGLITSIGEWVLRTACAQQKAWEAAGQGPIRLAVNLSSLQFRQPNLLTIIQQALQDSGLDSKYLEVELTESIVMQNAETTIATLTRMKEMGLHLAIDDFGTGYSSLSYLQRFSIDTIKIDRAFVRNLTPNSGDAAITKAIIAMAHGLKLRVLAEGVETEQQLEFLRNEGCDEYQGYLFSKPLPAESFLKLLRDHHDRTRRKDPDSLQTGH